MWIQMLKFKLWSDLTKQFVLRQLFRKQGISVFHKRFLTLSRIGFLLFMALILTTIRQEFAWKKHPGFWAPRIFRHQIAWYFHGCLQNLFSDRLRCFCLQRINSAGVSLKVSSFVLGTLIIQSMPFDNFLFQNFSWMENPDKFKPRAEQLIRSRRRDMPQVKIQTYHRKNIQNAPCDYDIWVNNGTLHKPILVT